MPPPSKAKLKRQRLGLPDKIVNPAKSEAGRKGAEARWASAGKPVAKRTDVTRSGRVSQAQAMREDRATVLHVLRKHDEAKLDVLTSAIADSRRMYNVIRGIASDPDESGDTRLKAAKLILDMAGITTHAPPPGLTPPTRDVQDMTPDELRELIASIERDIQARDDQLRTIGTADTGMQSP